MLFTLDARAEEANVAKAQAQLQKDLAALADAQRQLARSRERFAQGFISKGAVDSNRRWSIRRAVVTADRAAIEAARVAVSFSRITASSAGRAGAIGVFAGSMVQPSSPALVTITQLDPIAIAFNAAPAQLAGCPAGSAGRRGNVTAILPEDRGT